MSEESVRTRVRLQKIYLVACEKGKFLAIGENFGEPCAACGEFDDIKEVGEALVEWENDGTIVVHGKGFAPIEEGQSYPVIIQEEEITPIEEGEND